jgi:hypothetical protein
VTERRTLGDLDFEHELDNLDDDDGWYGRALSVDTVSSTATGDLRPDDVQPETWDNPEDTDRWYVPAEVAEVDSLPDVEMPDVEMPDVEDVPLEEQRQFRREPVESAWTGVLAPRNGRNGVAPTESWQTKLSNSGAWDFKASAAGPWYRSRRVAIAAITVVVTAIVMTGILLLLRGFAADGEESTPAPQSPTSVAPAPASPAPALSTAMAPPPPLPPPPPPPPPPPTSAEQITGPAAPRPYLPSRQSAPSQSDMPEIGVTRTPVTRMPMSATPPPPRTPDRNSSTPGDAPSGGGWGPW